MSLSLSLRPSTHAHISINSIKKKKKLCLNALQIKFLCIAMGLPAGSSPGGGRDAKHLPRQRERFIFGNWNLNETTCASKHQIFKWAKGKNQNQTTNTSTNESQDPPRSEHLVGHAVLWPCHDSMPRGDTQLIHAEIHWHLIAPAPHRQFSKYFGRYFSMPRSKCRAHLYFRCFPCDETLFPAPHIRRPPAAARRLFLSGSSLCGKPKYS